eukprot:bmy_19999T0
MDWECPHRAAGPSVPSSADVVPLPGSHVSILTVLLVIHIVTAPAYKHPLSDTMNITAKGTNSSDCWICPTTTPPQRTYLLYRNLRCQGKKTHGFRKLQLQMTMQQGFQPIPPEDEDYQHPLDKAAASFYSSLYLHHFSNPIRRQAGGLTPLQPVRGLLRGDSLQLEEEIQKNRLTALSNIILKINSSCYENENSRLKIERQSKMRRIFTYTSLLLPFKV